MIRYVRFPSSHKQHTLKAERETYCGTRVLSNPNWGKAQISDECFADLPLCAYCEKLGPLTIEDQRRFWRFTAEEGLGASPVIDQEEDW